MQVLTPPASDFSATLRRVVEEIQPGQRVQVLIPRSISHKSEMHDWDVLENIQMDYRGSTLEPDVFVVLRFDQGDESSLVTVDVCHLNT